MKKTALRKDFFREILHNKGRFISIFLIVTLGVAFFSGIRAAEPDMELTGDYYFDSTHMYDGYVAGTLGITEDDLQALEDLSLIEEVYGEHSVDVLSVFEDRDKVLRIAGYPDSMNQPELIEGRLPEKSGEIVLDASLKPDEDTFRAGDSSGLGQVLKIRSGTEDELAEILKSDTYTVVGYVASPRYFSFGRGTTTIGTGDVYAFAYVCDSEFLTDYYSYAYYRVSGAEELNCFSEAYEELMEQAAEQVKSIEALRCDARYDETYGEGKRELDDAKKELSDARKELEDGAKEIQDAKEEVADGKAQLQNAQNTLNSSRNQAEEAFADSLAQLQNVQETLNKGRKDLEKGWEQYNALKEQLEQQKIQLEQGTAQVQEGQTQLAMLQAAYEQAAASDAPEEELLAMEARINGLQAQLDEAVQNLEALEGGNAYLAGVLTDMETQLEASEQELSQGEEQLEKGWDEYKEKKEETEEQLNSAQEEINSNRAKLYDADTEIAENEEKLRDGYEELEENEQKVQDAEEDLSEISYPEWFFMDRMDDSDYSGFHDNAERMGKIGRVFPVIFFLLAALISLTTMTRMVEEQRIQIGTLKALGYSKWNIAMKFVAYAGLATVLGSAVGIVLGEKTLPYIILHAYTIMYPYLRVFLMPLNWYYGLLAAGAAVFSVLAATIYSSYRTLQEVPAELMLPPSPAAGKRILAERISFLWKPLSFSWKATVRNLSRYKKRLWMTLIGIGGCMALLMSGFGLRDSILEVVTLQYEEIQQYDADVYLQSDRSASDTEELENSLDELVGSENYMQAALKKLDAKSETGTQSLYLMIPEEPSRMERFISFRDRLKHTEYSLSDGGVILTEKAASLLEVKAGDQILLPIGEEDKEVAVTILAVVENYMSHYVYMTPALYRELTNGEPEYNDYMVNTGDATEEENETIGEKLLECEGVMNISYIISLKERLDTMLATLDDVIFVLIISAGLLAFVVLYNLNNINITERRRELATLKVLGFFDKEVALYVYRENIIITFGGILLGVVLGRLLHMFLITTVEVDQVMFGRHMFPASYVYSVVITLVFSFLVNWIMYYKLKKVDMVESLKSVE